MNTLVIRNLVSLGHKKSTVVTTSRGRALHTVDCFLNGKPVLRHHDNPNLKLTDIAIR